MYKYTCSLVDKFISRLVDVKKDKKFLKNMHILPVDVDGFPVVVGKLTLPSCVKSSSIDD